MTLTEIYTMLTGISGFTNKVAYHSFPVGEAPALPYICYYEEGSANFVADNKIFQNINRYRIMLLTATRSRTTEQLVEAAFTQRNIVWTKTISYLNDEKCFQIDYNFEEVE